MRHVFFVDVPNRIVRVQPAKNDISDNGFFFVLLLLLLVSSSSLNCFFFEAF